MSPALAHLFTDARGFGWLSEDDFVKHFAADVDPIQAKVLHAVQQALASSAFTDVMGIPAWKSLPSWYVITENDEALPPDAQRQLAARMGAVTVEIRRATSPWSRTHRRSRNLSKQPPQQSSGCD
jgi:alpha/beta hydrolase family protein